VVRVSTTTGKTLRSVRLAGAAIAVASGYGSVWALGVGATAPYNIWIGGGSVWVADDQGAAVIRIARTTAPAACIA
jgi:hypothetical protein